METLILAAILGVLSFTIITSNIAVLLVFLKCKSLRVPRNYFLISLALTDLAIGIISLIPYIVYLIKGGWFYGGPACIAWLSIDHILLTVSNATLMAVAFDRYMCVCHPLFHRVKFKENSFKWMTFAVLLFAVLVWGPAIWLYPGQLETSQASEDECDVLFYQESIPVTSVVLFFSYVFPTIALIVVNTTVSKRIVHNRKRSRRIGKATGYRSQVKNQMASEIKSHTSKVIGFIRGNRAYKVAWVTHKDSLKQSKVTDHFSIKQSELIDQNVINKSEIKGQNTSNKPKMTDHKDSLKQSKVTDHFSIKQSEVIDQNLTKKSEIKGQNSSNKPKTTDQNSMNLTQTMQHQNTIKVKNHPNRQLSGLAFTYQSPSLNQLRENRTGNALVLNSIPLKTNNEDNTTKTNCNKPSSEIIDHSSSSSTYQSEIKGRIHSKLSDRLSTKSRRAVRLLSLVSVVFVLCWMPYHGSLLARVLGYNIPDVWWEVCYIVGWANSVLNPVCYAFADQTFRKVFKRQLTELLAILNRDSSKTRTCEADDDENSVKTTTNSNTL